MHLDIKFIIPNMLSIDRENPPQSFLQSVVPWMLQSPVYPTIALLISSAVQSMVTDTGRDTRQEVLVMRGRVFSLIREYMDKYPTKWAEELMGCIINLIMFEVCLTLIIKPR